MLLLLLALCSLQDETVEKKVRALVEKLDADEVAVRNKAHDELMGLGEAVVPLLEKARAGAGAEARGRIEAIVGELTLPGKWAKDFQDDQTGQEAYTRFEAAIRAKTIDRKQGARILTAALLSEKTSENMKQLLISAVERHRFTDLWPAMLQLAVREDGDSTTVTNYLQRMRPPPEAAEEILKAVPKIKNRYAAVQILQTAANLKPDKAKLDTAVRAMLESDPDDNTRSTLLNSLSTGRLTASLRTLLGYWKSNRRTPLSYQSYLREAILRSTPDEAVKELMENLSSADPEDVLLAVDYASRHKLTETVGPLVEALSRHSAEDRPKELPAAFGGSVVQPTYRVNDSQIRPRLVQVLRALGVESRFRDWLGGAAGGPPRIALAVAIGELELKGLSAETTRLLSDPDPAVRRGAARTLGAFKQADGIPALEACLKDENLSVRRSALHAIVRIRGAGATAMVLEHLRAEHPDTQAAAIEVLPYMEADAVIDELTKEASLAKGTFRYALAVFLVHQGEGALHRVMTRISGKLSTEELQSLIRLVQTARGWR